MAKISSLKIKVTSDFKDRLFERFVLDIVAEQVEKRIRPQRDQIRGAIRTLVEKLIIESPEAQAMHTDGTLAKQLGFEVGEEQEKIDAIAKLVAKNLRVDFTPVKRRGRMIKGRVRVRIIKADYSDVLGLGIAKYDSENKAGVKTTVPWLEWLLTKGDAIIISDFGVLVRPRKNSRSKGAVMFPLTSGIKRAFRITPTEFTGTTEDNWLTRAVISGKDKIIQILIGFMFGKFFYVT